MVLKEERKYEHKIEKELYLTKIKLRCSLGFQVKGIYKKKFVEISKRDHDKISLEIMNKFYPNNMIKDNLVISDEISNDLKDNKIYFKNKLQKKLVKNSHYYFQFRMKIFLKQCHQICYRYHITYYLVKLIN